MQLQFGDALGDGGAGAGQKTRAHAIGDGAETQVEARRLDLVGRERIGGHNPALFRQRRDHAVGQNSWSEGAKASGTIYPLRSNPMRGLTPRRARRISAVYPVVI